MSAIRTSLIALALAVTLAAPAPAATPKPAPPTLHVGHVDILVGTDSPGGHVPFYYASPQGVRNAINLPGETTAMRLSEVWYQPLSDLTAVAQFRSLAFAVEPGGQTIVGTFRSAGPKSPPLSVRVVYSYYL
ncbi:MAG: hypothetical protein JWM80_4307 [Cyanobacteria bacterium RYN_339]|nr:hypothetical protein [Cyanobacteria bacterium RYN_339]